MKLVRKQNAFVKQETQPDIWQLICRWYKNNEFDLAKNHKHLGHKEGFKFKNLLCLRTDKLLEKFKKVSPMATRTDISRTLREKNALKLDAESKNFKIGNRRYYGIYIEKLNHNH